MVKNEGEYPNANNHKKSVPMKIMRYKSLLLSIFVVLPIMMNCMSPQIKLAEGVQYPIPENFSKIINGKQVSLYSLANENGIQVYITNYGGRIVSLLVPDKNGVFDDIVTGFHSVDEFIQSGEAYFGALIGRYANRIAGGSFELDGESYTLAVNNGPNSLHGGPGGFHNVVWDVEQHSDQSIRLKYLSPHMEEGFPGNLEVTVSYTLTGNDELLIDYVAKTDKPTVLNLTNHAFFNLAGEGSQTINNHMLKIYADQYTPVNENLIPYGMNESVAATPFDFRDYTRIGDRVDDPHQQIVFGNGYDHNFVLNKNPDSAGLELAASVYEPESMRQMDVLTTEPGIQFYGGNFLNGDEVGKRGEPYLHRTSFCLETQHYPDSPNQPEFPSTVLRPGETFKSKSVYRFSVRTDK